jgi:prolyl-tRNA editing enzyme YbaK/EbsC (Cys-tRNA(Pro) deacylase)
MKPMTIPELELYLSGEKIDFEILHHEKPIKSRNDALEYFRLEEMAPTLILKTENGLVAMIISGSHEKIDFEMFLEKLKCSEIKLASKDEVFQSLGMKTGEVAMVGHGLPCILDNQIFQRNYIFGGAGDAHYTLKINPHDLAKVNRVILQFG